MTQQSDPPVTGPTQRLDQPAPPYTPPMQPAPPPPEQPTTIAELVARLEWENTQIDSQLEQLVANANREMGRLSGIKEGNTIQIERLRGLTEGLQQT